MSVEPDFSLHPSPAAARAAAEALFERIAPVLRRELPLSAEIRHIGSTAIPGCLTKGDLDIVVRVHPTDFQAADEALAARFARNAGSMRSSSFASFEDHTQSPHLGIQLTTIGAANDFFHLLVERLQCDPALLRSYNALKTRFDGHPMAEYRAAKDAFIAEVLDTNAT